MDEGAALPNAEGGAFIMPTHFRTVMDITARRQGHATVVRLVRR